MLRVYGIRFRVHGYGSGSWFIRFRLQGLWFRFMIYAVQSSRFLVLLGKARTCATRCNPPTESNFWTSVPDRLASRVRCSCFRRELRWCRWRRRLRLGRWTRRCLVANRTTPPQKWPPPTRNAADSCDLTAATKPTQPSIHLHERAGPLGIARPLQLRWV